jgi:hypothetical protein
LDLDHLDHLDHQDHKDHSVGGFRPQLGRQEAKWDGVNTCGSWMDGAALQECHSQSRE